MKRIDRWLQVLDTCESLLEEDKQFGVRSDEYLDDCIGNVQTIAEYLRMNVDDYLEEEGHNLPPDPPEEDDFDTCTECGASNTGGEGYDGLCGDCADRKERLTADQAWCIMCRAGMMVPGVDDAGVNFYSCSNPNCHYTFGGDGES